jgi:hypothetical protein
LAIERFVLSKAMIEDKRKSSRQRLFLRGFIRMPQKDSTIDCFVCNISETGAKLRFRCTPSITDSFELHIPAKEQIVQSKLAWIEGCEVGISFEQNLAFVTPSPSDGELLSRMARLEDEITSLKQMLKCLQNEVSKTEAA